MPDARGQTTGETPGVCRDADTSVSGNPRPGSRARAPWPTFETKSSGVLCASFDESHERGAGARRLVAPHRSRAQNARDRAL